MLGGHMTYKRGRALAPGKLKRQLQYSATTEPDSLTVAALKILGIGTYVLQSRDRKEAGAGRRFG